MKRQAAVNRCRPVRVVEVPPSTFGGSCWTSNSSMTIRCQAWCLQQRALRELYSFHALRTTTTTATTTTANL